jgi:hypothetical protein
MFAVKPGLRSLMCSSHDEKHTVPGKSYIRPGSSAIQLWLLVTVVYRNCFHVRLEQTDEARQSTLLTAPLNRYHGTGKPSSKTRSKYIAVSYHSAEWQGCVVRLARLLSPV